MAFAASSGVAISTQAWPKNWPLTRSDFHTICVMPGKNSIKVCSSMDFRHIFFKNSRVTLSGLGAIVGLLSCGLLLFLIKSLAAPLPVIFSRSPWTSGWGIRPWSASFRSYSSISDCSLVRSWCLDVTFSATQRSQRTCFKFFLPFFSKHSLQMRLGTPHVGQRLFPRNRSQGFWQASHLLMGCGVASPVRSWFSTAAGLCAKRLSNTFKWQSLAASVVAELAIRASHWSKQGSVSVTYIILSLPIPAVRKFFEIFVNAPLQLVYFLNSKFFNAGIIFHLIFQ